jgi:type I restriction-modification system DNA methylase subunit
LLYRLLFVMFAEDRQLLPYKLNRTYTNNRSMGRHRDDIAAQLDRAREHAAGDYSLESTALWSDMQDLFDLVDAGHRTYGVPAYNGGLFDREQHSFLAEKKIPDYYMARIVDELSRAPDPDEPDHGLFRVDYRDLAIQHLGSIYEGLLELRPHHASERMIVASRRVQGRLEERVLPATAEVPDGFSLTDISYRKGTVYLQTDKGERRASGSYYTPDHIVDYIVENTLGPLCSRLDAELRRAIANAEANSDEDVLARLQREYDDRVLRLRVLDPAMGSGHFLIRACQYLAEEIATHPLSGDDALAEASDEESAVSFWKRRVAECCLYGVDLNPLAVELAKLALWLETVAVNRPLTFLDHHLRTGNSLIGARLAELGALPQEIEVRASAVAQQVEHQLSVLLEPLAEIRNMPSETVPQIKRKEQLYRRFEKAREPFRLVADLWTSTFVEPELSEAEYQSAIEAIARQRLFAQIARQEWFSRAVERTTRADIRPFHWELEFIEAFYATGRRADGGFDAVIGNPPYDVLSELESGRDLTALRRFIEHEQVYHPSATGKNNLYKLFVCRALEQLAPEGRFGFITPMAILGDQITAALRKQMISVASFTAI